MYGYVTVRSILSNLSYQIIGKTYDQESVRYYKQISEEIEKKKYSRSYGIGIISKGEARRTESSHETSKYKNQNFFGLKTGEFIVFSYGEDNKVVFTLENFERITLKERNHLIPTDLDNAYNKIINKSLKLS